MADEDARRLEQSYKILSQLQRKTLRFLHALGEREKNDRRLRGRREGTTGDEDGPSRLAFIVTPLMVNHYNHMHRVYRASVYGRVPDLCDQTGGIVCADLGSLREELATRTTDVTRSLTTTFRSTVLPDVRLEFRKTRDGVLETAVRLLDSINVKQPDLTYGIRDDYVQNVRAIQESLTSALERSKERTAELQSRLDEALRKLRACEKTVASSTCGGGDGANAATEDRLRREILRLRDTVLDQQQKLLEQEVSFNERFLDLVRANEESELMRRLRDRLTYRFENENDALARVRAEVLAYAEKEVERMSENFGKIRDDAIGYVKDVLARSDRDREATQTLFQSLLSVSRREGEDAAAAHRETADRVSRLHAENEELRRLLAGCRDENELLGRRVHDTGSGEGEGNGPPVTVLAEENRTLKERVGRHESDVHLIYKFFRDHVEAAMALASYMVGNGSVLYSDTSGDTLIPYLRSVVTDERVTAYIRGIENARAEDTLHRSGVLTDFARCERAVRELVRNMRTVHDDLAEQFAFQGGQGDEDDAAVDVDDVNEYFVKRFGPSLKLSLLETFSKLRDRYEGEKADVKRENAGLLKEVEELRARLSTLLNESQTTAAVGRPQQVLAALDGDPTVFEKILYEVYERSGPDRLRKILYDAYYACSIDNVTRYETSTDDEELKLYNLVDYDVLTDYVRGALPEENTRLRELDNPKLNEPGFFLEYFINQLGNAQIEGRVKKRSLRDRNRLALILFKRYYIPVINKESFVLSIEGPFANFSMVYKP